MLRKLRPKKAQSLMEYMMLIVIIVGGLIVFQKYILRAISGRWKSVGDSLGSGRQYDPNKTHVCVYDYVYTNTWYEGELFDEDVKCHCDKALSNEETCQECIFKYGRDYEDKSCQK